MNRSFSAFALVIASFAATASAQTCPVATNLEVRISGLHCQFPTTTWSPCGLSSPVTLTLYNHDTGQPYHLQSCETGVDWVFQTTQMPNQGLSIQVSYSTVGIGWAAAHVMSGTTQTQYTTTYIPFANGMITASAPKTTVSEADGTAYVNVHTTYAPTSFSYAVTNYDNAAGRFTPISGSISFASGEYDKTIAVPIIDDSTAEGTGRILVRLTNPDDGVNGVVMNQMNGVIDNYISITDNDSPVMKWAQNSYTFAENASNPAVTVTRTGDPATTASVDYVIGPSVNSPVASGTLTFNSGETSKSIAVPIVNDNVWSPDRHWIAELRNPSSGTYLGSLSAPAYVLDVPITIVDDDGATLSINDVSVNEGNTGHTNATLDITLSSALPSPFDVSLTYGGTATPGTDFAAPPVSVHFDAGQTSVPLTISVNGDTMVEANETVTATLSHVTGSGALPGISKATGTLTILNDDSSMTWLKLAAGTSGRMTINLGNPITAQGTVTLTSSKPDVVRAPDSFVAESGRSTFGFDVDALSPGESMITAKFPASLGGMTLTADVEVHSDQAPSGVIVTEAGPPAGPATGGTFVTVAGLNFTPSCTVIFGETPARTVSFVSTSALKVMTPAHAAGATDVTVACDGDEFTLANGFLFFTPTRARGVHH